MTSPFRLRFPLLVLTALAVVTFVRPLSAIEQWQRLTLSFAGPDSSEDASTNPFTDVRLSVRFQHADSATVYNVPGFYAADGDAAQTGAAAGNIWQVRFTPDRLGDWTWSATMHLGTDAVLLPADFPHLESFPLKESFGSFRVTSSTATGRDFRARGRLVADAATGYFRLTGSDTLWLKGGADSPENLLGYQDFDGTYRHSEDFRDGENRPNESLHTYAPHLGDWHEGDPTWRDDRGKGLIGALNYLASTGMNAVYFLTLNIDGDGKDVWPYLTHTDRDRFDCSRLDQWEIVFSHMQRLGLAMHVVTQETENERLLDSGFTGRERRLYYRELIARFGHHPALIWNLGEENGSAGFSPNGQTAEQQMAMADTLRAIDPYDHPIVIHTHSTAAGKDEVLRPLLGHPTLDGLAFQVDDPARVHTEIIDWRARSVTAGRPWLITMDEIGPWHTGAVSDADDPDHDGLRRQVLWGTFLAGGAGVEWYFGARYAHNDLSAEDWRSRDNLWTQTRHALEFLSPLPLASMHPADDLTARVDDHVLAQPKHTYVVYVPDGQEELVIDLGEGHRGFLIEWFNPRSGGELQPGSVVAVVGSGIAHLGFPPAERDRDWVALIRATHVPASRVH